MRIRMRLGMFDPPSTVAPNNASYTPDIQCQSDAHVALAKTAAQESIVLLKNANGVLPLSRGAFQCQCDASSYEDNTDYFQPNNPSSAAKDADDCCAQVRSYYSHLLTPFNVIHWVITNVFIYRMLTYEYHHALCISTS